MWTDPKYVRGWQDLRCREAVFWFFVLSYVPGILLIIPLVNVFNHDVPEHIGTYRLLEPYARNCLNCNLAYGALGP